MRDINEVTTRGEPSLPDRNPPSTPLQKNQGLKLKTQNFPRALMLLVFGVYLLTMSGHTYSPDEETLLSLSRSLVEQGSWAMTPTTGLFQVTGVDGRRYSEKGPGQSLAAVPWTAAGLIVGNFFSAEQAGFVLRFILGTFNALVGAGIAGLFAALCMALGYARRSSLFLAGALAFATFLWPNSRTFFAEPLVTLCLLAAFYLAVRAFPYSSNTIIARHQARLRLILSGAILAAAIAVKVQSAPAVLAFFVYIYIRTKRQTNKDEGSTHASRFASFKTRIVSLEIIYWLAGLAVGIAPLLLYNWLAFGGPFSTGYGYGTGLKNFDTPLYEGLYGLLLSPGKGLFWYALPLLISLSGFSRFSRRHRAETAFIILLAVPMLVIFSTFHAWNGDGAWGPRLIIPLVPFLLLPALPVIQKRAGGQVSRFKTRSLGVATIVALGFLLNLPGVLVNFDIYLNVENNAQTRYWYPATSPILAQASLLDQQLRGSLLRLNPRPRTIFLKRGFSYSEGNKARGKFLPRWTTGAGTMEIWPDLSAGSVTTTLRLYDHRPAELPRAKVAIHVNDLPVAAQTAPVPDIPIGIDYSFMLNTQPTRISIESDTWNPASLQNGARDEDIGVDLQSITVTEGGARRDYTLVEAVDAPPYYPQPLWYYDLRTSFPADVWPFYLARADMGNKGFLVLALPLTVVGLASLIFGWRGLSQKETPTNR